MRNKNGVTLIALTTMMLLIVLLTGTLTYVSINSIDLKKANEVREDLRILTDKVEEYYLKTDSLPIKGNKMTISAGNPTTTNKIGDAELPEINRNQYDSNEYYLINYELLDGVKLNHSDRAYVVNEKTHTIYAVGGFYGTEGKEYSLPYVKFINTIED